MIAVLTADLVNSTSYEEELLEKVLLTLKQEFQVLARQSPASGPDFKIFRGDSFQGIIPKPQDALKITLQIKAAVNRIHLQERSGNRASPKLADFRTALGIGTLDYEGESVSESNGQAFRFSGRTLDQMKSENQKTRLVTSREDINGEFNTSFFLMDLLLERWTTASAEVVYYLLQGLKEQEIAAELNISQSAVNQRKKASGWEAISGLLLRYEQVISRTFNNG